MIQDCTGYLFAETKEEAKEIKRALTPQGVNLQVDQFFGRWACRWACPPEHIGRVLDAIRTIHETEADQKFTPEAWTCKEHLVAQGGVLVDQRCGSTWNDGGQWNSWVYYFPANDQYWRVHQPTDYRDKFDIHEVSAGVETKVTYLRKSK